MNNITFSGRKFSSCSGCDVTTDEERKDAFVLSDITVVFLDPDANLGKGGQFRNLLGYSASGEVLWKAELPTEKNADVYWKIKSKEPLIAVSFTSYECEISCKNGKLVTKKYYK